MHELAFGITSANAHYGCVRNPHDPARTAGGSSGGTAAAIGAGAVLAGLATDTGGSGRIPAAFCGCAGFRPSAGRYPADGLLNLSTTLDSVTVMATSVDGVSLLDAVLADESEDHRIADIADLRLGVPRACFWEGSSRDMAARCEDALDRLAKAGATLVEVDAEAVRAPNQQAGLRLVRHEARLFWSTFARANLGLTLPEFADEIASPDVARIFQALGAEEGGGDDAYRAALREARPRLQAILAALFRDNRLDGLVFPTVPVAAPPVGETDTVTIDGRSPPLFDALTGRETPASIAGLPAISIPAGRTADGMPFALELDAPAGADRALIAVARAVEVALGPLPAPRTEAKA